MSFRRIIASAVILLVPAIGFVVYRQMEPAPVPGETAPDTAGQAAFATDTGGVTVAADGSGEFKTVQEAVNAAQPSAGRFVIRIKPGRYREKLLVPKNEPPIVFIGENSRTTILTFDDFADKAKPDGGTLGTFESSSVTVESNDFSAANITFENSHGRGSQALALRVDGDRETFRQCRFLGWQDTVLLNSGRQYFRDCQIAGFCDFIFGAATAFFDRCEIDCHAGGFITAASTPQNQPRGFVFSHCRIVAEEQKGKYYLGRPWRPFASVAFLYTDMPAAIAPVGWHPWSQTSPIDTVRFSEYKNTGAGAAPGGLWWLFHRRAAWSRQLTDAEAKTCTVQDVLGGRDNWDPTKTASNKRPAASAKAVNAN